MRKVYILGMTLLLVLTLFAYIDIGFTESEAILKAIDYHNTKLAGMNYFYFPINLKPGKVVVEQFTIKKGSPAMVGTLITHEKSVDVKKDGKNYIVTLTKKSIVDKKESIGYWKYKVKPDHVEILYLNVEGTYRFLW